MVDRISFTPQSLSAAGVSIPSEFQPGVTYRLERRIGEGGMGQAFLALREAPDGVSPVVIKLVRPSAASGASGAEDAASVLVTKEAVALGRLNERIPPCPFVVRFVDTGVATIASYDRLPTPWLAIEYVHGGIEGTTLEDRVHYSVDQTGFAFDAARAAHLIRCLASGLAAIHGVGVIHRDLTPGNVLCCGFGEAEIFKISDFGIAKPQGLSATFGGLPMGTVGYAAPEQVTGTHTPSPATDVFSFACLAYFILTGEPYFEAHTPMQGIMAMREKHRRSVCDANHLIPELRQRPEACKNIDQLLARATSLEPPQRPQQAQEFANALIPWITETPTPPKPSRRLMNSLLHLSSPSDLSTWEWTVRHPPGDDRAIQSAAWDVDGHCFAFTTRGPTFWNGQAWIDLPEIAADLPQGMGFARRFEAGGWLVGGAGGTLAIYGSEGVREVVRAPASDVTFLHANGRFDDLLAAVGQRPGSPPTLWAMAARRWIKPLPLEGVGYVANLLRLDDSHWLICGRLTQGTGFAAIYAPLQWEMTYLLAPRTRAFIGGASEPERGLGLIVGSQGVALHVEGGQAVASLVSGAPDLTAGAIDVLAREWVASLGRLWVRDPQTNTEWRSIWSHPSWNVPFVSIMADAGQVVAMTADGGVLEGRSAWKNQSTPQRKA
jgi:serine/threonine protein kinase